LIAIEVAADDPQAIAGPLRKPGLLRYIGEGAVAVVVIQDGIVRSAVSPWAAVILVTVGRGAVPLGADRPAHIVQHEEVKETIGIEIDEARAGAEADMAHVRLVCHVGKPAGAVILKQRVGSEIRDVKVNIAIVVVIACRCPHAVAAMIGPACVADIRESAAPKIAIHAIALLAIDRFIDRPALQDVQVEPAIVVDIQHCAAAADALGKEKALAMPGIVNGMNTCGVRDVTKPRAINCVPRGYRLGRWFFRRLATAAYHQEHGHVEMPHSWSVTAPTVH
jgi:hypothetical protein